MDIEKKRELIERQRKIAEENLNCYLAFEKGEKLPTPNSCLELEKKLNQFYSMKSEPIEIVKRGTQFLEEMIEISIDYKIKLAEKLYPKLQNLFLFFHNEWIEKVYRPESERIKKECKRIKNETQDKIESWQKGMLYEDNESHKLFIRLLDLISEEKRLDIFDIYWDIRFLSNSPSWWLFLETNKLCKKIGQYKDIQNVQLDKAEMLKFYSSASIVRSLYWCIMRIYENLFRLQNAAYTMSMIFEDWPNLVERFEKKEIDEKEFYYLIEEKYTTAHCVELNYIIPEIIAKIYATELDIKDELETSFALEYIPDDLREKMNQMLNESLKIRITTQNIDQKLRGVTDKQCTDDQDFIDAIESSFPDPKKHISHDTIRRLKDGNFIKIGMTPLEVKNGYIRYKASREKTGPKPKK